MIYRKLFYIISGIIGMNMEASATQLDDELLGIIKQAKGLNNKSIQSAFQQEETYRKARIEEIQYFSEKVLSGSAYLDSQSLKDRLFQRLLRDEKAIEEMNEKLKPFIPEVDVTWDLKANKMLDILAGTRKLLQNHYDEIISGKEVPGYKTSQDTVTLLGWNDETIFGNSKGSFLQCALLNLVLEIEGKKFETFDPLPGRQGLWIDHSAIAHVTPLPVQNTPLLDPDCSYFYQDERTPHGFIYTHSGYAFGGHRGLNEVYSQPRYYPEGKVHGPEDCSTWVAKLKNSIHLYSTPDQYYAAKFHTSAGKDVEALKEPQFGRYVVENYEPVTIKDPLKDIKPGDIYYHRSFPQDDPLMTGLGVGGHTTLVLGVRSSGSIVTIGYAREMPNVEGVGVQEFLLTDEFPKRCGILRLKD